MSTRAILQALVQYYEDLAQQGKIVQQGWGPAKVSYAIDLEQNGQIKQVISVRTEQQKKKKIVLLPQIMQVPEPVKRSSGIKANFLCDSSGYIFGSSIKGKPERDKDCFTACRQLHQKLLAGVQHAAAIAVLLFFENWNPEQTKIHPLLQDDLDDILGGANLVFRYQGQYLHEVPEIRTAWLKYYNSAFDEEQQICLVTGNLAQPARLHPSIKGIQGSQPSGASLVSYNAPAFCSYGKEQGMNAPTSEYAAFAYGAALNYLITQSKYYIGDTALLCWASGGEPEYQDILGNMLCEDSFYTEQDYQNMAKDIASGHPFAFQNNMVDPQRPFYVLGLSPNAARLSVRFFLCGTFGEMLQHILNHQERLKIIRPSFDKQETLSLWRIFFETINQNSKKKVGSFVLAGELLRAILTDTRYPASLLNGVLLRIRADHQITRGRAAIIKAYYLKNKHPDVPEEVLQVALNPDSTNTAYNLGRLFSVLEDIQSTANPGINSTICDKYFNSASATPAHVFPILINLSQKHLKKLSTGQRIYFEKYLQDIIDKLPEEYPPRMTLPQQGSFQLGYYHQTQARFTGKKQEETKNA